MGATRRSGGLAILALLLASMAPATPSHACGYGPQPRITVVSPQPRSINQTPFTISGTAVGATCDGVPYPVTRVTLGFWETLGSRPQTFNATCTCPGTEVTWSFTVQPGMFFPGLYTVDADAYDSANAGGRQRLQFVIL